MYFQEDKEFVPKHLLNTYFQNAWGLLIEEDNGLDILVFFQ